MPARDCRGGGGADVIGRESQPKSFSVRFVIIDSSYGVFLKALQFKGGMQSLFEINTLPSVSFWLNKVRFSHAAF